MDREAPAVRRGVLSACREGWSASFPAPRVGGMKARTLPRRAAGEFSRANCRPHRHVGWRGDACRSTASLQSSLATKVPGSRRLVSDRDLLPPSPAKRGADEATARLAL